MHLIHLQIAETVHQIAYGFDYLKEPLFFQKPFIHSEIDNFSEVNAVQEVLNIVKQHTQNIFVARISETQSLGYLSRIFNYILDADDATMGQTFFIIYGENKQLEKNINFLPLSNKIFLKTLTEIPQVVQKCIPSTQFI
ncbi:MAG: hypothetical protein KA313_09125 [Pseudarcicella sp.]|nr:hypothetical protein [Pseudarcicella sp.]MBP6411247.1 hypothetical protein [Pseudarcicella sp.]